MGGAWVAQLRSLERLLDILDARGQARVLSTMSDQFNVYPDTPQTMQTIVGSLEAAYIDTPQRPMFNVQPLDNSLTVTLKHYDEVSEDSRCVFPHRAADNTFRFEDLVYSTGFIKSGYHHPQGVLLLYGPGIQSGGHINACDNLDIAPTLLTLLDVPVPPELRGRVLLNECAA